MNYNALTTQIIADSSYKTELLEVMVVIEEQIERHQLAMTEHQFAILTNHVNEMINRSHHKQGITDLDITLFAEISELALKLSKEVTAKIANLGLEESYLLSIHFENARNKLEEE